jgi:hypothetical protein
MRSSPAFLFLVADDYSDIEIVRRAAGTIARPHTEAHAVQKEKGRREKPAALL